LISKTTKNTLSEWKLGLRQLHSKLSKDLLPICCRYKFRTVLFFEHSEALSERSELSSIFTYEGQINNRGQKQRAVAAGICRATGLNTIILLPPSGHHPLRRSNIPGPVAFLEPLQFFIFQFLLLQSAELFANNF
jgi:hypothetical protein